ncbi:MAG: hypothetical protein ACI8V5_004683 [Limisphaerales bacterium]|jgi:hypothetical protein
MKNQARHAIALFAATLLTLTSSPSQAQDANLIAITKSQNFQQDEKGIPSLIDSSGENSRFKFEVFIDPASPGQVTSASVTVPGGAMHTLQADNDNFHFSQGFSEKDEFDEPFAPGLYTVNLVGQNDGAQSAVLTLPADNYPNVPRIANWGAAQNIDSGMAFTLMWDAFAGGTTDDFVMVEIQSEGSMGDSRVFESAGPGDVGSLNGTSTSVSIPASTLTPGETYSASLSFFRFVASDTGYTMAVGAYQKRTKFSIKAAGGSDQQGPTLERIEPPAGTSNVKDISVVAFRFSEPMNTDVDYSQAIAWTGVADADNFSYTWSSDGTRLFCRYTPTLPLNTTIGWTLNPPPMTANGGAGGGASGIAKQGPGGPTQFQDVAGNVLQSGQNSGSFTTASASNIGEKDVLWFKLSKGQFYVQDGASVTLAGEFSFEFSAELNGFNTISSVAITAPSASPITFYSEDHGDTLEIEAEYAEKSDLDGLISNGTFAIQFNTFRDGTPTVNLDLTPENYPNAPALQNHVAAQAVDPTMDFTLTWNAMDNPGADDAIVVFIENDNGREIFETPQPGQPGALPGSATSLLIPANTLPPGREFDLEIAFVRTTDVETIDYPGVRGCAAFVTWTAMDLTTTGMPIEARLDMFNRSNNPFMFRLLGERNLTYSIESSSDFQNWMYETTRNADDNITGPMGEFFFSDPNSHNADFKYYRAREGSFSGNGNRGGGGNGGESWSIAFYPPLNATQCNAASGGSGDVFFSSQGINVDGAGNFSETWSPITPLIDVNGSLNGNGFSATLNCKNGPQTGSMSATAQNGFYTGTYSFENSGTVIVSPQTDNVSIQGRVIAQGSGAPISAASVSTSLDGAAVSTDANGFFFLQTMTQANFSVTPYTINVTASGFSNGGGAGNWGDHPTGQTFELTPEAP